MLKVQLRPVGHRPLFRNLFSELRLRPFPAPQIHDLPFTFLCISSTISVESRVVRFRPMRVRTIRAVRFLRCVKPSFQPHRPQSCVLPMSPACRHYVNSTLVMTSQLPVLHIPHFAGDRSMSRRNLPELAHALASSQSVLTPNYSERGKFDDFIDPKIRWSIA